MNPFVSIISILGICYLEYLAITHNIDGKLFLASIAAISGIGGYHVGKKHSEVLQRKKGGETK